MGGRKWACGVTDSNNISWIIGGYNNTTRENLNDVYFTLDFIKWQRLVESEKDSAKKDLWPRHAPGCVAIPGKNLIVVIAGKAAILSDNNLAYPSSQVINLYTGH